MTADDAGTVPEAGSDPTPTVPAPHHRPSRAKRFRAWRRARPFWGGLLLILSGVELIAIPLSGVLIKGAIKLVIYIGIGGVAGVVIGAMLIVAGLVTWFNPTHKTFYSIAGIVLGLASFPATNLGGLVIGMLLAILGGSIAFAWTPFQAGPAEASPPVAATDPDTEGVGGAGGAGGDVVPLAELMTPAYETATQDVPDTDPAPEAENAETADTAATYSRPEARLSAAENEAALS
jgi:hypothetical protein